MSAPTMPDPAEDFDAFYRRTHEHVMGILWRAGVRREAVREELAQEIYLQAHRGFGARSPAAPERAWVCAIAWNVVLQHAKLKRTRAEEPMDEPPEEPVSSEPSAEDVVADRRRYLELAESTTSDRRIVFEMFEVEGWTLKEIAAALALPEGTVTTRLRLAREDLSAADRMRARERRVGHVWLLPFGERAWRAVTTLFEGRGKAALAGAGFGLVAGGALVHALHLLAAEPPRPASPPIVPEAILVAAAPPPAPASAAPTAPAFVEAPPPAAATPHRPASASDPSERRLLAQAESALARGRLDEARAVLAEWERRFPPEHARRGVELTRLRAKLAAADATDGGP